MIHTKDLGAKPALPKLLAQIQEDTLFTTNQCLENLFAVCDDLFYDLSNRASSNNEQTLYFESMREIRIKKQGVINAFQQALTNNFLHLIEGKQTELSQPNAGNNNTTNLSLVENDDLEIELAISSMATRTRKLYLSTLYELTLRLDHLFPQVEVTEKNNPLDPEHICHAFAYACKNQLEISIKPQIIIFKQFERYVLNQLGHCYSDANQLLINTGILPKIPRNLQRAAETPDNKQPKSGEKPPAQEQKPTYDESAYQFNLSELTNILSNVRTIDSAPTLSHYASYSNNPGPEMGAAELVHLLTKAQTMVDEAHNAQQPKNYLHPVVSQLLTQNHPEEPQSLKQLEDDIINLVAMFFEFILEDENISFAIRAQISRLQIPILKVAIRDNNFFNDSTHPARRLIDTIAEVGIALDENKPLKRDSVYQKIKSIIQTINNQYTFDESIFATLLDELTQVINKEQRKSALIEQRTSQAESGKSQIKLARAAARKILIKKLHNTALPDEVRDFLVNTWFNALIITYLKYGEESSEWVDASQTVDDLIWACQQHNDTKALKRISALVPDLLHRISNGLAMVSEHPDSQAIIIKEIEDILYQAEKNGIQQSDYHPISEQQIEALLPESEVESNGNQDKSVSAIEQQQEQFKALSYEFIQKAEQLAEGTWLKYEDSTSAKVYRCKLAAKLEATETYIFVNRFGFKALEKQRKEFAYDMQQNRVTPLDNSPLFTRVIGRVVKNLKQVINQPAAQEEPHP